MEEIVQRIEFHSPWKVVMTILYMYNNRYFRWKLAYHSNSEEVSQIQSVRESATMRTQ